MLESKYSFSPSRREFVAASTLATAGLLTGGVHAGSDETLKIGLVGCGGRGTGAAKNALLADPNVKLVAMGDAFEDRLHDSLKTLQKSSKLKSKIDVPADRQFSGFDAFEKVIQNCDVVLLCTPPHFRPQHLKAAIEAGKHVFCEKPVAVDAPGVRSVIETAKLAKQKNIALCSGFCYRHDLPKIETVKRIHDGAIGDVAAIQITYNTSPLWWNREGKKWTPEDYGTMEYQMRNWYYFTWLSGDHIVEQHCHNMDKARWVLNGQVPIAATGLGGRQVRIDPKFGNIYDHHSVIFEFANGVRVFSFCRQMPNCKTEVSDHILGAKGTAELQSHVVKPHSGNDWKYKGEEPDMYDQEHLDLFASIRRGEPINDGESAAQSTLMAILGRTATYTGQRVTWNFLTNDSNEKLAPPKYDWGTVPAALSAIAVPGTSKPV